MVEFNFEEPAVGDAGTDISTEFRRQLLPLIDEIVRAAVAAGWNEKDVLLALVELTWDLYEDRRADLQQGPCGKVGNSAVNQESDL